MLLQSIKESIKLAVRTKEVLFWTMIFPLLLSTMFYFSFGKQLHIVGSKSFSEIQRHKS